MSMMAAPARPESRSIAIAVVGKDHNPLEGAAVSFFEDDKLFGTVITGIRGASITLSHVVRSIDVKVVYADSKQETTVSASEASYTFVFARKFDFKAPKAIAQCPNGDTGQPCVDCVVDGKKIRICA
jgi:hypothetical protein